PAPRGPRAGPPARAAPAAPAPAPPPRPAPAAPAAEMAGAEAERLGNQVMQTYLSYRKQDPFDLLGVAEGAAPPAIEARFLDFAARYAPWKFAGPQLASLEEKARDLFLAGARAYGQLADREQ